MSDARARLDAASTFLLQSPPGEVNDVLSDLRAILASSGLSDSEIESGLLPALTKHTAEQFTVVESQAKNVLVTPASRVEGACEEEGTERHVEPREGKEFVFDHLKGLASSTSPHTSPYDEGTLALRSSLDKLLSSYVSNHYASGVAAVYTLPDPVYPAPEPAKEETATAPEGTGETGSIAQDVEGGREEVADVAADTAEEVEKALPEEGVETVDGEGAAPTGVSTEETEAKGKTEDAGEEDKMDVGTPAAAPVEADEETPAPAAEAAAPEPPQPRPSCLFGIYLVGHKYNPGNYWTGRWRSTYQLDYANGTLEGTAQINIHYYEQGNVQLSTTLKSSATLSSSPSPESVVASIKATESSLQRQLGETYNELSDASFRGLRRALPKTRSKLDWDKATGMRLGQQIGGGAQ
ncbi:WASH complex, F-actin capping protein, alpha subunit [Rhodotorula toruloides]|uniref:WASH complex, F-actin capping protein, alpha subunit n=1 Tax=Rhodotorula toruloides TaxID=5286 RepID=A0A511KLC8_RHOTO|nr:WASH complex, F-actin capping protein, alpha subunit [Rhodotorula toruloides]